ncbi:alkaline phosphatase family protein, partial [candidate division KSB1 bacterium]|nr:alkaline phosphatase family protein [candidate division KSB1 bacterium]
YRNTIYQAYESSDAALGYILKNLWDKNTVVLVLSDHGFQSEPEAQGRKPDRTVRILPEVLMATLNWNLENVRTFNIRGATFFRDREENAARIQKMEHELRAIRVAASDAPLFEVNRDPSNNLEIRLRDEIEELDDFAVRLPEGRVIAANKIIEGDTGGISGDHHDEGILIAAGAGIRRGFKIENASVLDMTPTMLALMGLPVGRDMDGRVLEEMFTNVPPAQYINTWESAAPQFSKDEEETTEELKNHLRSLGYL